MTSKRLCIAIAVAGTVGMHAATCQAADAQPGDTEAHLRDLERKLEQSVQRIDELNQQVQQLQRQLGAGAAVPAPLAVPGPAPTAAPAAAASPPTAAAPAADSRIDELTTQVEQLSQSVSRMNTDTGVPLHGFADVGARFYTHTDPNSSNPANGANEKAIDFYLNPEIGPRIKTLMEIAIETSEYDQQVGIDMERLQVGYVAGDELTVWAGRFHTPYGYWNTAFHHGPQIQTSAQRPKFLAFEDTYGLMPAHTVGLWATGHARLGSGRLTYDATVGNSPRILTNGGQMGTGQVDMNLLGSNNHSASSLVNVGYEFGGALDGLKLGVDAMRWRTTDDVAPAPDTTQVSFAGAYAVYVANDWEILNEYYRFHDTNTSSDGSTHNSWAAYSQVGYTLLGAWTPYARWEEAQLDQADNYFAALAAPIGASYRRYVGGLRYDLARNTALKAEYGSTVYHDRGLQSYNEVRLQIAVRF